MRRIAAGTLGLAVAILAGSGSLLAETPDKPAGTTWEAAARLAASAAASPEPDTYGTATETALYVGGSAFTSNLDPVKVIDDGGGSAYFSGTGASTAAWAPVYLPQGAQITGIDFYYYDADATTDLHAVLYEYPSNVGFNAIVFAVSSGSSGIGSATTNLGVPWTVNNSLNAYSISVFYFAAPVNTLKWRGVKVRYKLQVSPAPGVASFTDVPTSYWAFQYIEALKASGITAGVTPTTYEPESNVTRAQMAVFLAKALGLHFPN